MKANKHAAKIDEETVRIVELETILSGRYPADYFAKLIELVSNYDKELEDGVMACLSTFDMDAFAGHTTDPPRLVSYLSQFIGNERIRQRYLFYKCVETVMFIKDCWIEWIDDAVYASKRDWDNTLKL